MSQSSKVSWKDGMFLLPQHFQQAERHMETALQKLVLGSQPLGFGVLELSINEQAMGEGRIELLSCRAIWPDGTSFDAPQLDAPHPRSHSPAGRPREA